MTFSPRDLVNANIQHIVHITVLQTVINGVFDRLSNRVPVKSKRSTNHLAGHFPCPGGQEHAQTDRKRAFVLCPWDRHHFDATGGALNPLGLIDQKKGNPPKRHALALPLIQGEVLAII